VFPSFEGWNDGPSKNDLTQYLAQFHLDHYHGSSIQVDEGQQWSKLIGPFLLYANNISTHEQQWADAKLQHLAEKAAWPYAWVSHPLYQARSRSEVRGRLVVVDALKPHLTGADAWVGLAPPTNASDPSGGGGWQNQGRDYEYWIRADGDGRFNIKGVRPGTYTLYAWNVGVVQELALDGIDVGSGVTNVGNITLEVPRAGGSVIVWEIGIPNRDTSEFYHGADFWQPMLHLGFPAEFSNPLVYDTKSCDWHRSINYAQSRYFDENPDTGREWMWLFKFELGDVTGDATVTVAFAAMDAALYLYVNQDYAKDPNRPVVRQAAAFADDTLIREGGHGKFQWFNFTIPKDRLLLGSNVLAFSASSSDMSAKVSLMYDYISLEMAGSAKVQPGHCWDANPGWGLDVFLSPAADPTAPQQCRPNVVYFDRCLAASCPLEAAVTHAECAKFCAARGCAVFTINNRGATGAVPSSLASFICYSCIYVPRVYTDGGLDRMPAELCALPADRRVLSARECGGPARRRPSQRLRVVPRAPPSAGQRPPCRPLEKRRRCVHRLGLPDPVRAPERQQERLSPWERDVRKLVWPWIFAVSHPRQVVWQQ
jgi:hypothetical protein